MTPKQFRKAEEVFQAACVLPAGDRTSYVESACQGDSGLRDQVYRLLEHDRQPGVVLDTAMGHAVRSASERVLQNTDAPLPQRIGAYKILRQLGEGGFGVVYLAEQERPRRTVALKVVRWTAASHDALKRFEHETHILGQLQHPGIAQIFEAGVADVAFDTHQPAAVQTTVPYYAMEYIQGKNLLDFAAPMDGERPALNMPDRLELIARVCDALQHANQNGIIHRDLKPDNILVIDSSVAPVATSSGTRQFGAQPKLLDFGIARALEGSVGLAPHHTTVGQLVGTPAYMSPEQVRGDPSRVDIRSDIYTVGVLLYQLLAGRMPYDFGAGSMMEVIRAIEEQTPSSLRTAGSSRTGRINADVDAIVSKALAKDPQRRYQTAEALASDIRRYLANEPIEAKRDSTLYVLRKQLRKYRGFAVAGVMLIGLLICFGVYASYKARSERILAEDAVAARNLADEKARELARSLYFSNIGFAHAALEGNDIGRAKQLLAACPPELRNWEYHFIHRLADRSVAEFNGLDGPTAFAVDPAKHRLFIGRNDGAVSVIELRKPDVEHATQFECGAFGFDTSPDGNLIATGCADGRVVLFDPESAAIQKTMDDSILANEPPDPANVGAIAFSPDGSHIVSGGLKGLLRAWKLPEGTALYQRFTGGGRIYAIRFTPDGKQFLTADVDGSIRICDAATGAVLHVIAAHQGRARTLDISPDGRLVASGGDDSAVRIWDLKERKQIASLLGHRYQVYSARFSPDGTRLVSGSIDHTARLWDVASGELLQVFRGHLDEVRFALFSDPSHVLTFGRDGVRKLWSLPMEPDVSSIVVDTQRRTITTRFSPDGKLLLAANGDGTTRTWDVRDLSPRLKLSSDAVETIDAAFSPDGRAIASGGTDRVIRTWNAATGALIWEAPGHTDQIHSLAYSPDGARIFSCDLAGSVRSWEARTGAPGFAISDDMARRASALAFSPDGKCIAVSGGDGRLELRRADDGRLLSSLPGHVGIVSGVAFSPDGARLASVADDGILKLWDMESLKLIRNSATHQGPTFGVCFSSDGSRIATGGYDHSLRLWDAQSGEEILTLRGHRLMVGRVSFSPDGRCIASTSEDGTIRIWATVNRTDNAID